MNDDCLACARHGNCSIEYLGGEAKVMTALEMDAIMGAAEAGMEQLNRGWDAEGEARKELAAQLDAEHNKGNANYLVSESPEGIAYFEFALRQIATMESIIETVHPIFAEVKERADQMYQYATGYGNKGN
jgi:uncharacterized protein (DUF885 family)